eukprot:3167340-Pyramimonas_sp.AAC.1
MFDEALDKELDKSLRARFGRRMSHPTADDEDEDAELDTSADVEDVDIWTEGGPMNGGDEAIARFSNGRLKRALHSFESLNALDEPRKT